MPNHVISATLINNIRESTKVFYHSNCPDGITAREIVKLIRMKNSEVEFIPFNPGTEVEVTPHMVFFDCSPIESQWESILQSNGCIIDHHESVLPLFTKYSQQYTDQLLFGDTSANESGAWLAFLIFEAIWSLSVSFVYYTDLTWVQTIANLISTSDCWITTDKAQFEKARALAVYIVDAFGNDLVGIPTEEMLVNAIEYKKIIDRRVERAAKKAIIYDLVALRLVFYNTSNNISEMAEYARNQLGANIVIGWHSTSILVKGVETTVTTFSVRSDNSFDCSAFAKYLGGGGHKNAAGFKQIGVVDGTSIRFELLNFLYLEGQK